jgi:hypothetical protein
MLRGLILGGGLLHGAYTVGFLPYLGNVVNASNYFGRLQNNSLIDFRSHMIHSSSQLVVLDLIAGWICCRCCWSRAHRLPPGRVNLLQDHHRNVKGYWKLQDTARQHPQASSWSRRGCFGRSGSPGTTWRWLPSRKRRHGSSSAPGKSRSLTTLLGMCLFCNVHVFVMTLFSR